jgi:hypothetical protein
MVYGRHTYSDSRYNIWENCKNGKSIKVLRKDKHSYNTDNFSKF